MLPLHQLSSPRRHYLWPQAALEDLCLGIPRGQRFGFLGPNGAGKTTTLSILAGRQTATAGAALIAGVPAGSAEARRQLGYCPQVASSAKLSRDTNIMDMEAALTQGQARGQGQICRSLAHYRPRLGQALSRVFHGGLPLRPRPATCSVIEHTRQARCKRFSQRQWLATRVD